MTEASYESICALAEGDEADAHAAIGKFQIEECGFFTVCNHAIEKFDFVGGREKYVKVYYCGSNYTNIGIAVAAVIVVMFIIARKVRRKVSPI